MAVITADRGRLTAALATLPQDYRETGMGAHLSLAIRQGFWEGAKLLLEGGTPAIAFGTVGTSALQFCAEAARPERSAALEVARRLLEGGGVQMIGERGEALLETVAVSGNAPLVRLLLLHAPHLASAPYQRAAQRAAHDVEDEQELIQVLDALGDGGVDLAGGDEEESTALHAAAYRAKPLACAHLCGKGLSANARDLGDSTPLHLLGQGVDPRGKSDAQLHQPIGETLNALLAHGADINARAGDGNTPLIEALERVGRTNSVAARALLEAGADIEARSDEGFTALHWAASRGNLAATLSLLERGANALVQAHSGDTPRQMAEDRGHVVTVALIDAFVQQQALDAAIPEAGARSRTRV